MAPAPQRAGVTERGRLSPGKAALQAPPPVSKGHGPRLVRRPGRGPRSPLWPPTDTGEGAVKGYL